MRAYSEQFFQQMSSEARGSAAVVVPLVVGWVRPRSVVDVGCGAGTWLAAFRRLGIDDVLGVDGDYVDRAMLEIPSDQFQAHDLATPLRLNREFDLVLSLEVAEHLPAGAAETFVDSLMRAGPVILFSAAIPHQGGTYHINEQWPEYWAERFARRGYDLLDCMRGRVWHDPTVAPYYAQNMLMFIRQGYAAGAGLPIQELLREPRSAHPLSVVHPRAYVDAMEAAQRTRDLAHALAAVVPAGDPFIFVDAEAFRTVVAAGSRAIPFMERDGVFWGFPPDDEMAIAEVERQRAAGIRLIVFPWTSFWCLEHYPLLREHLEAKFRCVQRTAQLIAFEMTPPGATGPGHR